jgi:hypothetical protein
MAIKKMYALLDHTAQIFLNPITFTNDADAIRWFTTVVNNEKEETNINKYPESFTLYRLADYDDKTAEYLPRDNENEMTSAKPKQLITGVQVTDVENTRYSLKDMLNMLKMHLTEPENVTDIKGAKK